MKTLDLNNYGVQEMNAGEMINVDGGIIPLVVMVGIWAFQATICGALLTVAAMQKQKQ